MSIDGEILHLLKTHGAVLERTSGAHNVWKFPDGRIFTDAKTPSDHRSQKNALAELRRLLGVKREAKKNPDRREKTQPPGQLYQVDEAVDMPDWKRQLIQIKVAENNPMLEVIFRCDACGHHKGEEHDWLLYRKSTLPVFEIRPWDGRIAKRKEYGHLCSDTCAIKKMTDIVRAAPTDYIPTSSTEIMAALEGKQI